jgi:hypothetical protein
MGSKSTPKVVKTDPVADADAAANEAAAKANAETATRKRRKADSSLLSTGGAQGVTPTTGGNLLSTAAVKDTLGS